MPEHSVVRPHGHILIVDPGSDTPLAEFDTMQCCHCGGHFVVRPGSGTRRGFCMKCNGVTCGKHDCWDCNPYQKLVVEGHR